MNAAAEIPDAVVARVAAGHALFHDPPRTKANTVRRWSCGNCGHAVLVLTATGFVYGSATELTCPEGEQAQADAFTPDSEGEVPR